MESGNDADHDESLSRSDFEAVQEMLRNNQSTLGNLRRLAQQALVTQQQSTTPIPPPVLAEPPQAANAELKFG